MPLLLSKPLGSHSAYAVWNIQETNEKLQSLYPDERPDAEHITKTAEWLVGRILIKTLCAHFSIPYEGITVEESGKPNLAKNGAHISISHSFPMAAAIINLNEPCGIDVERPRHKMIQVREKFINGAEKKYSDDLEKLCAIWCGKEVLYKIYSRKKLSLKDDTTITFKSDSEMIGLIKKEGFAKEYPILFEKIKDFCLAYNV